MRAIIKNFIMKKILYSWCFPFMMYICIRYAIFLIVYSKTQMQYDGEKIKKRIENVYHNNNVVPLLNIAEDALFRVYK